MSTSSDESFLARWSRMKRRPDAVADDPPAEVPREDDEQALAMRGPQDGDQGSGESDAGERGDGDVAPKVRDFTDFDFEALDFESDYTQFMKDDVPVDARNKALRQLWLSNPVLANMDGLDDYCEDYTDAAMVPLNGVKTAYKIGRGFLSDAEVAEWEALGRVETADADAAGVVVGEAAESDGVGGDDEADIEAGSEVAGAGEAAVGMAGSDVADAGCPGAACAAVVKQEERAALASYDEDRGDGAVAGAGAKAALPDSGADKDPERT